MDVRLSIVTIVTRPWVWLSCDKATISLALVQNLSLAACSSSSCFERNSLRFCESWAVVGSDSDVVRLQS